LPKATAAVPAEDLRHHLSSGLSAWLAFEARCGRERLFNERYLALPIAQLLANAVQGTIVGEHHHPVLTTIGRAGRPPQIDYAVKSGGVFVHLLETKWLGPSPSSASELIWDCIRLELAAHHYGCDSYFLIAGPTTRIDGLLASPSFRAPTRRGKSALLLNVQGLGRSSLNIVSTRGAFRKRLYPHLRAYPAITFPQSFICETGIRRPVAAKDPEVLDARLEDQAGDGT
jgi:hypothetical protein